MKTLILFISIILFALDAGAQEKVNFSLDGSKFSFEGYRTFKPTAENMTKSYYSIEGDKIISHTLTYTEDADLFGYKKEEVLLSELNFKSATFSDMNKGTTLPYEGWLLCIETKKMKRIATHYMYTFVNAKPGIDKMSNICFEFNKKADAEKFLEKLKGM
jgi:hypothetical protein